MNALPDNLKNLLKRTAAEAEVFQNHMLRWTIDYVTDLGFLEESLTYYRSKPKIIEAVRILQAENLEQLPEISTPQTKEIELLLSEVCEQNPEKAVDIIAILTSELAYRRLDKPFLQPLYEDSEFNEG